MTAKCKPRQILVLDTQVNWVNSVKSVRVAGYATEVRNDISLADLAGLTKEHWDLVVISSVGAVCGQKRLLETVHEWFSYGTSQPVAVVSPLPSPTEARDALYAGAINYGKKPWGLAELSAFLKDSFDRIKSRKTG